MRTIVYKCVWNKVIRHCKHLFASFHSIALLRLWYMIRLKFYNTSSICIGSMIFMTGLRLGRMCLTKSSLLACSAICKALGSTKGTISWFTNSLVRQGYTLWRATLGDSLGRIAGKPLLNWDSWRLSHCETKLFLSFLKSQHDMMCKKLNSIKIWWIASFLCVNHSKIDPFVKTIPNHSG